MNHRKKPERRTFYRTVLHDLKPKKATVWKTTFSELTELDDGCKPGYGDTPTIIPRKNALSKGMDEFNGPSNEHETKDNPYISQVQRRSLLDRIKSVIARIFSIQISAARIGNLILVT